MMPITSASDGIIALSETVLVTGDKIIVTSETVIVHVARTNDGVIEPECSATDR